MKENIHLKYLAVSPQDLLWGLAVNSVGTQTVGPGEPYPPTGHPSRYLFSAERGRILNEYQLLYITEGRGYFRSGSLPHRQKVEKGCMFLLFPGEWHSYMPDPETGWKEFWIGFNGPLMDEWLSRGFFSKENPLFTTGLHDDTVRLYQEAIQAASAQESGFQQRLLGIVTHLLGHLVHYGRRELFSEVQEQINQAKIIVADEFRTIGPEELASRLCMGYSNFRKVFRQYTGFSPAKYIQDVRFAHVKEVLTNTTLPVKEVAYEAGFDNYDYFFTAFRRLCGMTPTEYRDFTRGNL